MGSLLVIYVGGSLLLALLSLPMIFRKIKPNPLYGFRVPQTLNNPQVWYDVNSYAGKWLLATGIVFVIAAVGLYLIPGLSIDFYAIACLVIFTAAFTVSIVQCMRYLKRLGQ